MINPKQTYWFPMRVTYGREITIKKHLDNENIESFIPMHYAILEKDSIRERKLVPAVTNLIFVRSTLEILNDKKHYDKVCEPLRYIMRNFSIDSLHEIMTVSDEAMENFMKVARIPDDKVFYLEPGDYVDNHIGKRVTVIGGPFVGVQGIIKRIKRNKHVVVQLEGLIAAAIDFVPNEYLIETI